MSCFIFSIKNYNWRVFFMGTSKLSLGTYLEMPPESCHINTCNTCTPMVWMMYSSPLLTSGTPVPDEPQRMREKDRLSARRIEMLLNRAETTQSDAAHF